VDSETDCLTPTEVERLLMRLVLLRRCLRYHGRLPKKMATDKRSNLASPVGVLYCELSMRLNRIDPIQSSANGSVGTSNEFILCQ
jgi:hypothetical protein